MKKLLFITAVTWLGFTYSYAQVTFKPGVRAGLNFSKFTNTDADMKTDFYLGATLAIKFVKFYTLQPELTYSRQGVKFTQYSYNYDGSGFDPILPSARTSKSYSLDYLTVGIINKFTFGKGFQVMVGPSLDFKVNDNFSSYYTERPEGFDLSLVAGVGYAFPNGLAIEARIKQGIIDIFGYNLYADEDNYYDNNGNYDDVILNQVIQLGVSYTFGKK